jgi:type IV pilus assembly protein PilW
MKVYKVNRLFPSSNSEGFTLVELLITMLVSGVIMAGIYTAYLSQQRMYTAQEQVVEMQQNIRAALDIITRGIRMAGYDPLRAAGSGFLTAQVGHIRFTQDIEGNGAGDGDGALDDAGEFVDYGFSVADDADRNGIPDAVTNGVPNAASLSVRMDSVFASVAPYQAIADNIQAIEFLYRDSADNPTAVLADIRLVRISILARTAIPDPQYTNNVTYTPASGVAWDLNGAGPGNAANDNFRRRLLITTVQCRNMGL